MNIGLVLSGGMAKGAYQVGALQALEKFVPFEDIKYMSCASIGVLNGYAYATGNLKQAEQMWKNVCCDNTRLFINQILRSSMLQQRIVDLYDKEKDIEKAFYCSLFDLKHTNIVYKNLAKVDKEQILSYLRASVAMPVYNKAVQIDNTAYFDGAMIDNIPIFPLLTHNLDYVICIYFDDVCYKFENAYLDNKTIKLTFPSKNKVKQSLVFEKEGIERMIQDGYERTNHILRGIFSDGYDNLDSVYSAIEYQNRNSENKNLRITGDVLVTNLNKVTQKLTKKKII